MKSARLEAFSDGVIAVVVTIMVLELHVPAQNGLPGLLAVAPRLAIYLLSFLMTGIYWINHHELARRSEEVTMGVLWANLAFLFALSLIPFFTDYIGEKHFDAFSTLLYSVTLLFAGACFFVLRDRIMRLQGRAGALSATDKAEATKHLLSVLLYLAAIGLSFRYPHIALAIDVAVTLVWIVPGIGAKRLPDVSRHVPRPGRT